MRPVLSPCPTPLLPGTALRTQGPGWTGERDFAGQGVICAPFLLNLRKPSVTEGPPAHHCTTPSAKKLKVKWRVSQSERGRAQEQACSKVVLEKWTHHPQSRAGDRASVPAPAFPRTLQVPPCPLSGPQEWRFLPFLGRGSLGSTHQFENKHGFSPT